MCVWEPHHSEAAESMRCECSFSVFMRERSLGWKIFLQKKKDNEWWMARLKRGIYTGRRYVRVSPHSGSVIPSKSRLSGNVLVLEKKSFFEHPRPVFLCNRIKLTSFFFFSIHKAALWLMRFHRRITFVNKIGTRAKIWHFIQGTSPIRYRNGWEEFWQQGCIFSSLLY